MKETTDTKIRRFKVYLLPAVFFLVSFLIILYITLPIYFSLASQRKTIEEERRKLETLRGSLNTLESLSSSDLDSFLSLTKMALPNGKDIISIYSALSTLSPKSGVTLKGFSIRIGELYEKNKSSKLAQTTEGVPLLSVSVRVSSPQYINLFNFSENLYKSLPIAEIKRINMSDIEGTLEVNFFYKPYDTQALARQKISFLTPSEQELLLKLNEWKQFIR